MAAADPAQPAPQAAAPARAPAAKQQTAPMAIAPPSEAAPSARSKVAARTPPAQAAGGAYVVQVSAQKTEEEAKASYQALQQKYPSVLSGRDANIRRADLGDKGVYYRAQVGPFANAEAANTFCTNLKNAGGQCIVQKN
jgi:cell division protein FtsN